MEGKYKKIGIISIGAIAVLLFSAIIIVTAQDTENVGDSPLYDVRSENAIDKKVDVQTSFLMLDASIVGGQSDIPLDSIPITYLFGWSCSWGNTCVYTNTCNGGPTCGGGNTCNMGWTCGFNGTCANNGGTTCRTCINNCKPVQ